MTTASAEAPPTSPFERVGGHPAMRAITDRFYDLMEQDPAYAELRTMHAADLAPGRPAPMTVEGVGEVMVVNDLTAKELEIIKAGGLLNQVRQARA